MTIIDKLQKTLKKKASAQKSKPKRVGKKTETLQDKARDHLWMHFTRQGPLAKGAEVPVIVKGSGHHFGTIKGANTLTGFPGYLLSTQATAASDWPR